MEQAEQGTIIKDLGRSLPTLDDFFYNDLEGTDAQQLPEDEKTMFYQEAPPQSAEHLGVSPDGSLLTLKVPKEAFNITMQGILSNSISGNAIRVDLSKAEYGGYDNVKAMLEQFKASSQLAGYYATMGADNEDLFNRNGMQFAANLRLLYTNIPEVPRFTSTEVENSEIIKKQYGEIKNRTESYVFCNTPYPYKISYKTEDDGNIKATCASYDNVDVSEKMSYADTDEISFIKNGDKYCQVIELEGKYVNRYDKESSGFVRNVLVLNNDRSTTDDAIKAYAAKNELIQNINSAKDIRLVLDINAMENKASATTYMREYPLDYKDNAVSANLTNYFKDLGNKLFDDGWYKYAGYVPYGLDKYRRISGVIYVQQEITKENGEKELVWYNLNKKLIAETNNRESPVPDSVTSPTDRYHIEYGPTSLKPYTYDYANKCYVDRFWREAGENEIKRIETQKKIFEDTELVDLFPSGSGDYATGNDVLYRWTVSLGDVTFFVPPESIRVVSQTDTIRIPIMRAKGSIAKGRERSLQYLELNLFFNEERGINGVPFKFKSPNGKEEFVFKMNGFRALLAQMKFTPFLPITNKYINEELGIYAVCIENINVGTVPGFPKLLKAQIMLSKFNWQVYMPEIPQPDNDSKISKRTLNPFSACIDYDTMRWYYQRCILLGDELDRLLHEPDKAKRITVNSLEFYTRTIFANRTALLPCRFMDPNISVYIADENHLKNLLQIKRDAMKKSVNNVSDNYNPTENEARLIKEADQLASNVDINGIYAKYIGFAPTLLAALERSRTTNEKESAIDPNGITVAIDNEIITYKGKTYDGTKASDTDDFLTECLYRPMQKEYEASVADVKNEEENAIISSVKLDKDGKAIVLQMDTSYLSEPNRRNTMRESSVYLKKTGTKLEIDPDDIFKDSQIALSIYYVNRSDMISSDYLEQALNALQSYFGSTNYINPKADKYNSLDFLNWCRVVGKGVVDANDEAARLKQSIDWEDVHSLKYKQIIEEALVTQFSASVGNTYARIGVTGVDGSAPQYMGAQDIHLSWTIETKDEYVASVFKNLPELTAYYNRTYRKVLPAYPVKIDSEFTRMLGVIEVALDNVVVSTVEGFPGLYRIVVNATSVDRTLRNREAFKLLELKGQTEGIEDNRKRDQSRIRYFRHLDEAFSQAEVYPDLELPKIGDLGKLGWRYIRYRAKERQNEDFYIDPDFYFVYPELTVGRAIVESLRCSFDEDEQKKIKETDMTQLLTGTSGDQRVVHKNGGIDRKEMNRAAKENWEDIKVQKLDAVKEDRLYYMDLMKSVVMRMPTGSFDVGKNIRCVFTEPYYIKENNWAKDESDIPDEKVYEVKVKDSKQETLDKAAEGVSSAYARIKFVTEKGEYINTVLNPNWKSADSKKVAELFERFEKCANELEQYLADNDGSLNSQEGLDKSYDISLFEEYLNQTEFWTIIKKYGIFERANLAELVTEENVGIGTEFVKNGKVNIEALSENQKGTVANAGYLIQAVADALSGNEECSYKNKTKGFGLRPWQADLEKTRVVNGTELNYSGDINWKTATSFGVFNIRKYSFAELYKILPKREREALEKSFLQDEDQFYVLDPYYRKENITLEQKKEYLRKCSISSAYCAKAFIRIVLWYMAQLIRYNVIPSIEFDIKRQENVNACDADKAAQEFLKKNNINRQSTSTLITNLRAFAQNNGQAFDTGKFFAAILLALTEEGFGKHTIFDMYNTRNYDELNHIINAVTSVKYKVRNENSPYYPGRNTKIRKYLLALYGYGIIDDPNNINKNVQASPASKYLTDYNTKIALEACSNPEQYMRDSFFDMCRYDYRGRMLRAFPTFYMIFADEGREVGLWKLHDNFYNFNAIHEIQIVKSRKIPADTCKILLSNMFQTFTTNDEDCIINYKGNIGDLWHSFLNPREAVEEKELQRLAANKINRAKLQTGVRIHVRMGYGANAADLPCCFNGVISDIKPGELVEIVAQGDGVELCNPIYMEADADTVQNNDNFATMDKCVCGAPPKDILQGFLTAKGGPMAAWIRNQYRNGFFGTGWSTEDSANKLAKENAEGDQFWARTFEKDGWFMYGLLNIFENNPYGIRHFGDPGYRDIFAQGEPAQNLYEVTNKAQSIFSDDIENKVYFGDGALDLDDDLNGWSGYDDHNDLLYISFKPYGRTVWDIMHICKSVAPDYVTGIADFQFRSTVFLGKPHYYYAYKYAHGGDKIWYEKRKPYQQWHLYNNFSDIVDNKISASSEKMKTNAVGTYEVECISGMKKTAPMWVDQDIYPEYQKSMIVDTKLYGKSWVKHNAISGTLGAIPVLGTITDKIFDAVAQIPNDLLDEHCATLFDKRGSVEAHSSIAEDAVIDALKNSVKEMYQGYIIVLGDPSVKPNDRIQLTDSYEDMSGLCDVREVVHSLSAQTGFTTTLTPDAISCHDLKNEIVKINKYARFLSMVGTGLSLAISGAVIGPRLYEKGAQAIKDSKSLSMAKNIGEAGIKDINSLVAKIKELNIYKTITETTEAAKKAGSTVDKAAGIGKKISGVGTKATQVTKSGISHILEKLGLRIINSPRALKITGASMETINAMAVAGGVTTGVAATSAVIVPAIIVAGAIEIIGSAVNTAIARKIKGMQTLYIFPLRKFGKALTAGLDGQQGLVYGTVQFNTPGPIEQLVGKYLSHSKGDYAFIKNAIRGIFLDEQVMELADKWDTEENDEFIKAAHLRDQKMLSEADLQSIAGVQLDKAMYRPSSAYALSLMPRTMVDGIQRVWSPTTNQNKETIWQAVRNRFYIDNIKTWMVNPNLRNLIYLEDSPSLRSFFDSGFLLTLPQAVLSKETNTTFNKDNILEFPVHMPKGDFKQVIGIKRTEKQTSGEAVILDVPYLSIEGVTIIKELCFYIQRNTPYLTKPDMLENNQRNKDTSLIISSALLVGSKNPLYGSGFHMILTGTGKLGEDGVLKKYVQEYYDKLKDELMSATDEYERLPLFTIDKDTTKNNEVGIDIAVPSPFNNNIAIRKLSKTGKITDNPKNTDTLADFPDNSKLEDGNYPEHVYYSELDGFGRCGMAYARITYKDVEAAKKKNRQSLSSINPSGWKQISYIEDGMQKLLYNRCHLIAHSLEGEEANPQNLITGTAEFNERMYTYEEMIQNYVSENKDAVVIYKVTPVYNGTNLVASSVIMQATDINAKNKNATNDKEKIVSKNVFEPVVIYNTAIGWNINYATGEAKRIKSS